MTTVKFQSEAKKETAGVSISTVNSLSVSIESLVAGLESVLLGLSLRNRLSRGDQAVLDSTFFQNEQILITKDNQTIYPIDSDADEFSVCLVMSGEELSVCDLQSKYTELVDRIEHAWPAILTTASRISRVFQNSDIAIVINRNSGRIIAVNKGFCAVTGLLESDIVGREYGTVGKSLMRCFAGKKLGIENFSADEVYLSLISINAATTPTDSASELKTRHSAPENDNYRFVDETRALGLHFDRFNTVLESNLHGALSSETLEQVEKTIDALSNIKLKNRSRLDANTNNSTFLANLRLLMMSNLMSHRIASCGSSQTDILVFHGDDNNLQVRFDTPIASHISLNSGTNDWRDLIENLAGQMGIEITEIKITENKIVNRIYLQTERTNEKSNN